MRSAHHHPGVRISASSFSTSFIALSILRISILKGSGVVMSTPDLRNNAMDNRTRRLKAAPDTVSVLRYLLQDHLRESR